MLPHGGIGGVNLNAQPSPTVITDLGDLARWLIARLDALEATIMTANQDLQAQLARLQTAVTSRITATQAAVETVRGQAAAIQATLDQFVADDATEDADFEAKIAARDAVIADLQSQVGGLTTSMDEAVSSVSALATAVEQAPL